jgi:hypothetical protein
MAKSKKSETKIESETVKGSERHSIPTMGERRPSPKGSSVIDRHRRKLKPTTKSFKDSERPVIALSPSTQDKFVDFSCIKEIFDLVEKDKKQQQSEVSSEIYERFVDALWIGKCQPANPNIEAKNASGVVDAKGQFIVSAGSKIKINMPETKEGDEPEDTLISSLINAGVNPANAERLVANEVSFVPSWSLNFTDLMRGEVREGKINAPTQTQKSAADILFCAINGEDLEGNEIGDRERLTLLSSISNDGWIALKADIDKRTVYVPVLVDSKDFLDRVCSYADNRDELRAILAVFSPVYYCQRVVFAPGDSETVKKGRMLDKAKVIVG